jgi:ubiquinol-cytochrome c reductase cytochrome c subunit
MTSDRSSSEADAARRSADTAARAESAGSGRSTADSATLRRLAAAVPGAPVRRSRLRRRQSAAVRLVAALTIVGGLYTAFAPSSQAEDTPKLSDLAVAGKRMYDQSCISCHGNNGQGVDGRGPSLIGVGSAAVDFQITTGRMPLARQEAQADRKEPAFGADTPNVARAIGQYIQELGGGPQLPAGDNLREGGDPSRGGALFRVNCASCHAFSANGGALSSGKYAPSMKESTDRQIYSAMLTGPQNMPVFGDNQLTPDEKRDVIAYIQDLKQDQDPGGFGLGRYGPVPEGLVIFLVGIVALIFASLWIAGKS